MNLIVSHTVRTHRPCDYLASRPLMGTQTHVALCSVNGEFDEIVQELCFLVTVEI